MVVKIKNITAFWVFYLGPSRSPSRFVLGNLLWVLVIDLKGKKLNSTLGFTTSQQVYKVLHALHLTSQLTKIKIFLCLKVNIWVYINKLSHFLIAAWFKMNLLGHIYFICMFNYDLTMRGSRYFFNLMHFDDKFTMWN